MASINITIIESPLQKVAGIPSTITLTTNIPVTIFYTLDGEDPTSSSLVYVDPIELPTNENTVVFKAFATNGVDTCPIIEQLFGNSDFFKLRRPHDKVLGLPTKPKAATFPYGDGVGGIGSPGIYGNTGGPIVDNSLSPQIPDGYDGTATGTPAGFTNEPYTLQFYDIIYAETDHIGQTGRGIGTLPATTTVIAPSPNNETVERSDTNSAFFNARALVIFQDGRHEPFDPNISRINRPHFSSERPGVVRDGALLQTVDGIAPSGSLLRTQYNSRENTITYYYYDNRTGRWIISVEPFVPTKNTPSNLSNILFSPRRNGSQYVYKWIPFKYRTLF